MKARIAVLALVLSGCAPQQQTYGVSPTVLTQRQLRDVVIAALVADVQGHAVDTLFMLGATVVADGRVRVSHPFFSGIRGEGQVTLTGFQAEILSGLAWVIADYRWLAKDGRTGAFARATLVLEPVGESWRIKHAHSSSPTP